jgi:isopentenyl diphosphate isomerase/L-lactate dehydrogenase-like FMN-dependent dehydrogenase
VGSAHEALGSSKVVNIEDLRHLARRRLLRAVFDYLDGGADREITLIENCSAFNKIYFRPSSAVAFEHVDLGICILGHQLALPFLLAPIGYSRLMHPEGEPAAARAAGSSG